MAHEPDGVIDHGETPIALHVLLTGDQNVDGLLVGPKWADSDLTYSFPSVIEDYKFRTYPEYQVRKDTFSSFTAKQEASAVWWLGQYDSVSGLDFTELDGAPGAQDEDQEATLRFANGDVGDDTSAETAVAYYPMTDSEGGDAWFETAGQDPDFGDYDWYVIGHEIGHMLGLKHPHEAGGLAGATPVASDSSEFSIMSYRSYVGQDPTIPLQAPITHMPQSLMMLDIRAIQQLYGASFGMNATDSVYSFDTATGAMSINGVQTAEGAPAANVIFRTIWDGNGTDTYDFSNYTRDLAIDLRPGFWTDLDVGGTTQKADLDGNSSSLARIARGHVFNALQYNGDARSLIENAVGGSGDDTLTGNDAWNTLDGGTGDDTYFGGIGNDTIIDEDGANTFDGGTGTDTLDLRAATVGWSVGLGTGVASYSGIFSTVVSIENVYGGSGNDVFIGNASGNRLEGGDGDDSLYGSDGVDTFEDYYGGNAIFGGNDRDTLDLSGGGSRWTVDLVAGTFVKAGIVSTVADVENVLGGSNDDTITGDNEDNTLYGGDGDDVMTGGQGSNTLYGGDGDDTLTSTLGLDELFGGNDEDTFFTGTFGVTIDGGGSDDTVFASTFIGSNDFDGGDATDTIDWSATFENGLTFDLAAGTVADAFGSDRMANFEHLTGTDGNDTITGTSAGNTLDGGDGLDTLYGGDGIDLLYAGSGDGGQENLYGGNDADLLFAGTSTAEINYRSGAGNDLLYAGATLSGATDFYGGSEIDWALFTNTTSGGTFTLGSAGTAQIGGATHDLFDIEKLTGTLGDDTILGDGEDNYLTGNAGNDSIDGGTGDDTLYGGAGDDTLFDDSGDNTLDGAADDDSIEISAYGGTYDIDGGTETDHLKVNSVGWTVDLVAGIVAADQGVGGTATGTVAGIEDVTGSIGDDNIIGDGEANSLEGSSGTDTLTGNAGTDTLNGNGGEDYLYGGSARDYFREEDDGSFNIVSGGGGTDTLDVSSFSAGATVDPSTLDSGSTTLSLFGIEKLILTAKGDEVSGVFGDIVFGRGADILTLDLPAGTGALYDGGRGNDRVILAGSTGAVLDLATGTVDGAAALVDFENATGTAQGDTILGSGKSNVLQGADGADTVSGLGGADTLEGGAGADDLRGGGAADVLLGGGQGDTLSGEGGDDTLDGGNGDDTLTGGAGADSLTGGAGADEFVFGPGDSGVSTGQDRITDFLSATDRIDLTAFGTLAFVFGAGFAGTGTGEVRQQVGSGVSVLEIDADGNGTEEAEIILDGVSALLFDFDLVLA